MIMLSLLSVNAWSATATLVLKPTIEGHVEAMSDAESSLSNCKQLVENVFDVIVVRIRCTTMNDLKKALSSGIMPVTSVTSSILWVDQLTSQ